MNSCTGLVGQWGKAATVGIVWKLALDLHDAVRFARCRWFWRMHYRLAREYRNHTLRHEEGSFTYGETATSTIVEVLSWVKGARFVDLGSGRGLPVLVAASLGWQAFGLEFFAEHARRAQRVSDRLGLGATFQAGDFLYEPWPNAELYFTCSTAFTREQRDALAERFAELSPEAAIVTLDWDLSADARFERLRRRRLPVTWGAAEVQLFRRK